MKYYLNLHCAVLLLGGTALFSKLVDLPALDITAFRSIIAGIALLLFSAFTKQGFAIEKKHLGLLFIAGLLMSFHWVTYFKAMQVASVSVGIIALFSFPVFTAIFEPLFHKQIPKLSDLALASIVFVGVGLTVPGSNGNADALLGVALGIASAVTYALRNIVTRRYLSSYSPTVVMGYQALIVAATLLPFSYGAVATMHTDTALMLLVLGTLFTAVPHAQINYSFRRLTAKSVSFIQCLQVVYAISLSALILGEQPSWLTLLGGAIVLGVSIVETKRS